MTDTVVETERLVIRQWRVSDRAEFLRHLNSDAVMHWLGGPQDEATYVASFERVDSYQRDFGHTFWIVERKSDGAVLGFCGIKRVNAENAPNQGDFEIGWRLREDCWGEGVAKEAAIACLDLAFGRFGAPHVVAFTVPGNRASWGLMERLGMHHRPDLDFTDPRFGPELNPTIVYRIDSADWPAARLAALAPR